MQNICMDLTEIVFRRISFYAFSSPKTNFTSTYGMLSCLCYIVDDITEHYNEFYMLYFEDEMANTYISVII